ncbi:MAG: ATP-binding cassette domain-containing protein [Balneolaceae bacterium]|nr:ATP-binding cassette domain-containing protein [Balneolaceae bacterium]
MELKEISDQLFGSLSTGQQQRAKLASALFGNPQVLLLDEPGANLDERGRTLIREIVQQSKEKNRLVIIASNNPEELDLCDRVFSVEEETK